MSTISTATKTAVFHSKRSNRITKTGPKTKKEPPKALIIPPLKVQFESPTSSSSTTAPSAFIIPKALKQSKKVKQRDQSFSVKAKDVKNNNESVHSVTSSIISNKTTSGNQSITQGLPHWLKPTENSNILEILKLSDEERWYSKHNPFSFLETNSKNTQNIQKMDNLKVSDYSTFQIIQSKLSDIIKNELNSKSKKSSSFIKLSSDEKWMNDVIQSGTLSDKIAALALKVQGNPILELESLDILLSYALRKEQRSAELALEAIKDLFIHNLLPDRHLVPLKDQPLYHSKVTIKDGIYMWYENELHDRMKKVIEALDMGLKSTVIHFKKSSMLIIKELLASKPEQEGRLLKMLVNKLGDPSIKISSYAVQLLNEVTKQHPAMRLVIVREVRQFISLPNLNPRVLYTSVLFLSQLPLNKATDSSILAIQLVDTYVSLFEKVVKQNELKSKLLSVLLIGINRVYPYLSDKKSITKHTDALFRLVHDSSFTTSTRALVLISYIALGNNPLSEKPKSKDNHSKQFKEMMNSNDREIEVELVNRYYRALYSSLSSEQILSKSHNTVFLNLLYRSMKYDSNKSRICAFIKRILVCITQSTAPITAGLLLLLSEVLKHRLDIKTILFHHFITNDNNDNNNNLNNVKSSYSQHDDIDKSSLTGSVIENPQVYQLGNFDISKREPSFALSGPIELWEVSLLQHYYHPSIQAFTKLLLSKEKNHEITYTSDPTLDFSIIAFLNRFAYKNPKKKTFDEYGKEESHKVASTHKRHASSIVDSLPVNSSKFLELDENVIDPEKKFFYKFFYDREKLRESGKVKTKRKKMKEDEDEFDDDDDYDDEDDDYDDEDEDEGERKSKRNIRKDGEKYEEEVDKYADQLADQLMKSIDQDDADIDDDFSDDEEGEDYMNIIEDEEDENSSLGGMDLDDDDDKIEEQEEQRNLTRTEKRKGFIQQSYEENGFDISSDNDNYDEGEIIEFGDEDDNIVPSKEMKSITTKKKEKSSKKNKNDSKSKNNNYNHSNSDFADVKDYEEEMEDILRQIRESQQLSGETNIQHSVHSNSSNKKKKNKKQRNNHHEQSS